MKDHPIPLPIKGDCIFVDNSAINTYFQCPRAGAYSFSLKRKPATESPALIFGSAIHEAMEVLYRNHHGEPLITEPMFDDMVSAASDYYNEHGVNLDVSEYRNLSYAIRTLSEYVTKYRYDQIGTHVLNGEPCVEIPFALPVCQVEINREIWVTDPDLNDGAPTIKYVGTLTVYLTGKIDMVVRKGRSLYILDHKTSSMGGAGFFDEFHTSTQFKGYKWAAQQLVNEPIKGVIINALICRKPLKSGNVNYEFERATIPIHDDHVDEWQNTFSHAVDNFIQMHVNQMDMTSPEQAFPMQTSWCKGKYGKCKFYDVCTLRPAQRQVMLFSSLYTDDTWSPIKSEERVNLPEATGIETPSILPNIFGLS